MLTLAIPALSLEWGDGALRQFPEGNETRVGAELAAETAGPGASGPMQIVADASDRRGDRPLRREAPARPRGCEGRAARRPRATATRVADRRAAEARPREP